MDRYTPPSQITDFESVEEQPITPDEAVGIFEPVNAFALVAPLRPRQKTKGGIILTDEIQDAQEQLNYIGKLLAVGPHWQGPAVGSYVSYSHYAGMKIAARRADDTKVNLRVIKDKDVMGIVHRPFALQVYIG